MTFQIVRKAESVIFNFRAGPRLCVFNPLPPLKKLHIIMYLFNVFQLKFLINS